MKAGCIQRNGLYTYTAAYLAHYINIMHLNLPIKQLL